MIQIMVLIVGVVYLFRRRKISRLEAAKFPDVPEDKFTEWKGLEMKSIDRFLWASWGLFAIDIALTLYFRANADVVQLVKAIIFIAFLVLLVMAAIPGTKAAKLKKQLGIKYTGKSV